jgi:chromosome segregation ATPase
MYTSDNTNKENLPQAPHKEALVQKLQGALQGLRRERDQTHRSKELALERLKLVLEEEQALCKTVNALKHKHANLVKGSNDIQSELGPNENKVKVMTQKVGSIP